MNPETIKLFSTPLKKRSDLPLVGGIILGLLLAGVPAAFMVHQKDLQIHGLTKLANDVMSGTTQMLEEKSHEIEDGTACAEARAAQDADPTIQPASFHAVVHWRSL
jgi:hypothetical protein